MIELKNYQERAVEKLKREVNDLLELSDNKICVFKSPTGSGKTIMMAEFLKRLVEKRVDGKTFSFIWIAVNKLHDQSKNKLEQYFEDNRVLHCANFDDLTDKKISENEILFFNWQSINKKDNLYIRENEKDNNLSNVIDNTKSEGREIILVIDESHHTATSEKSREIISIISPKVTIEVSATPKLEGNAKVEIDFQSVKEEGMIKTEISINPEINQEKVTGKTADEIVIESALKKRAELLSDYEKEGSNVNPLILIQIPDNKKGVIDRKEDIINTLKDKFNITVDNGRLAIYLSDNDNKLNLTNIEKKDNPVEVLIFKQAIALGWDCPRASILILFRDWQSLTFSIQTVGRIMRMPEFKHYNSESLNKGYVFTNLSKVEIAEDIAKDYITIYESKRNNDVYKTLNLNSIYLKRQREKTRLSGQFSKIMLDVATTENTHRQVSMDSAPLVNQMLVDGKIVRLDETHQVESKGKVDVNISLQELQYKFDIFIRNMCEPFAPSDSAGRLKSALYKFFRAKLKIEDYTEIQKAILSEKNNEKFINFINKAKEVYTEKIVEKVSAEEREIIPIVWDVPLIITHTSKFKKYDFNKSVMKPFYDITDNSLELEFIEYLDKKDNSVIWWYKNGEVEPKYFAISYTDSDGILRSFYPDFIFQLKDGRVGIVDTKGDLTAKISKEKSEALAKYIKEQNQKYGKKLFGGIVLNKNSSWRYNDLETYSYDDKLTGWKYLEL